MPKRPTVIITVNPIGPAARRGLSRTFCDKILDNENFDFLWLRSNNFPPSDIVRITKAARSKIIEISDFNYPKLRELVIMANRYGIEVITATNLPPYFIFLKASR